MPVFGDSLKYYLPMPYGCLIGGPGKDEVHQALFEVMSTELRAGNRWGFMWVKMPNISNGELCYYNEISVDFLNLHCTKVEEAEKLYVEIYRDMICRLNSIRVLRPFFDEFPLTPKNFHLSIGLKDEKGYPLFQPFISSVTGEKEEIVFAVFNPHRPTNRYVCPYHDIARHPIAEIPGLKDLYAPKLEKAVPGEKPKIPCYTTRPKWCDTPMLIAEFTNIKRICSAHDLEIVVLGAVGQRSHDRVPFGYAFRGLQRLQLADAQKLTKEVLNEILGFVRKDKDILSAMRQLTWVKDTDPLPFPQPDHVMLRLSFWDEDVNRVEKPCIAEVRVRKSNIQYFVADEYQRLELVHEEPWEGAEVAPTK